MPPPTLSRSKVVRYPVCHGVIVPLAKWLKQAAPPQLFSEKLTGLFERPLQIVSEKSPTFTLSILPGVHTVK